MASAAIIPTDGEIVNAGDGFTLRMDRTPNTIVKEATLCANALMAAVRKNNWAQKFGTGASAKEHLFFEAWSFLATMYRVTPRVRETRFVQIGDVTGYEAYAEAFHIQSGIVISTADSMCLDDEDNWDLRPEYEWQGAEGARKRVKVGDKPVPLFQLRSMAQTRAMAKALRGPFSWIIAMAGYAPTPGEEVGGKKVANGSSAPPPPQQKSTSAPAAEMPQQQTATSQTAAHQGTTAASSEGPRKISEAQRKRLWGIAKSHGLDNEVVVNIVAEFGFKQSDDITMAKYDEVIAAIENAGPPPA